MPVTRDVEAEDASAFVRIVVVDVVADEQRNGRQTLQGRAEIAPHHRGQPADLAVEGQRDAFDLLVVLEFDGEQPDHLDRDPGGAGDPGRRVLVGDVDLLDVARGDEVAHGGPAVPGEDDPTRV